MDAAGTVSDSIAKANATISVTPYNVIYDGQAHTATGTATGVKGESLAVLNLIGTTHVLAGTYSDTWTFTDVTGNYKNATGVVTDSIHQGTANSISTNFVPTAVPANTSVLFSSSLSVSGLSPTATTTVYFMNQTIAGVGSSALAVPNSSITYHPGTGQSTTSYANGAWHTDVYIGSGLSGSQFLAALAYQVPSTGLAGGIKNIAWSGQYFADHSGVSITWKWAAAAYSQLPYVSQSNGSKLPNYNSLGLKPVDDSKTSAYQNSDHAGTTEAYKSYVIAGAMGFGGSNYTGSCSNSKSNIPAYLADAVYAALQLQTSNNG
jgi:hypothetical protein